jgi:hypothetical protein
MTERQCHKCPRAALPGSDACSVHDHATAVERGRKGGTKTSATRRAKRAEQVRQVVLATADDIRNALNCVYRAAYEEGDYTNANRAAQLAITLTGAEALAKDGKPADVIRLCWPDGSDVA